MIVWDDSLGPAWGFMILDAGGENLQSIRLVLRSVTYDNRERDVLRDDLHDMMGVMSVHVLGENLKKQKSKKGKKPPPGKFLLFISPKHSRQLCPQLFRPAKQFRAFVFSFSFWEGPAFRPECLQ